LVETQNYGFADVAADQVELGDKVRALLAARGIQSLAADGYGAPGVVVCYTDDDDIQSGRKFVDVGLPIAAGVPLMCDEPDGFKTFRLGLFGLDKLRNIDRTVASLEEAIDKVF
jgi:aspartate aminotransferase-like enzyme